MLQHVLQSLDALPFLRKRMKYRNGLFCVASHGQVGVLQLLPTCRKIENYPQLVHQRKGELVFASLTRSSAGRNSA